MAKIVSFRFLQCNFLLFDWKLFSNAQFIFDWNIILVIKVNYSWENLSRQPAIFHSVRWLVCLFSHLHWTGLNKWSFFSIYWGRLFLGTVPTVKIRPVGTVSTVIFLYTTLSPSFSLIDLRPTFKFKFIYCGLAVKSECYIFPSLILAVW